MDSPDNYNHILTFLYTALTALGAFCGFLVKKILELYKENIVAITELKAAVNNCATAIKESKQNA